MSSTITNPTTTYANTTVSSTTLSSGSGLTYTAGTGINATWQSNGNYMNAGTIHGKDFILDGMSLKDFMEQRLAWMVPNPELEKEWEELQRLGDAYRKLEAECKEKSTMWKTLKKT